MTVYYKPSCTTLPLPFGRPHHTTSSGRARRHADEPHCTSRTTILRIVKGARAHLDETVYGGRGARVWKRREKRGAHDSSLQWGRSFISGPRWLDELTPRESRCRERQLQPRTSPHKLVPPPSVLAEPGAAQAAPAQELTWE
jgi:hypothetical protein